MTGIDKKRGETYIILENGLRGGATDEFDCRGSGGESGREPIFAAAGGRGPVAHFDGDTSELGSPGDSDTGQGETIPFSAGDGECVSSLRDFETDEPGQQMPFPGAAVSGTLPGGGGGVPFAPAGIGLRHGEAVPTIVVVVLYFNWN